ncbi:MAG: aspartyl protease family protein, partial [Bacteroidota bacterium]
MNCLFCSSTIHHPTLCRLNTVYQTNQHVSLMTENPQPNIPTTEEISNPPFRLSQPSKPPDLLEYPSTNVDPNQQYLLHRNLSQIVVPSAQVLAQHPTLTDKTLTVNILFDTGATSTTISKKLVDTLNLPTSSQSKMRVNRFNEEKTIEIDVIDTRLNLIFPNLTSLPIRAHAVDSFAPRSSCSPINLTRSSWSIIDGLKPLNTPPTKVQNQPIDII